MAGRWNRQVEEGFIEGLREVLDDDAIMNIGERLAAVQRYRFRRRDDRLFLLKHIGATCAHAWDELVQADPSKPRKSLKTHTSNT